jgi:ferredoxin
MNIEKVKLVTFSPTGNSKKIAESIAEAIKAPIEHIDITSPKALTQNFPEFKDELTIIASPVYVGRVPYEVSRRIHRLKADDTPAVLVVTYGNRAYEDALFELSDIVSEVYFKPIAAGAFLGEHSWSVPEKPVAHGRPDSEDITKAKAFGKQILKKLEAAKTIDDLSPVKIPGDNPYTLRARRYDPGALMSPYTDETVCTKCGNCVEVCPTGAIQIKNVVTDPSPRVGLNTRIVSTEDNACIWCTACVKNCPSNARIRRPKIIEIAESLNNNYPERKEPDTFL